MAGVLVRKLDVTDEADIERLRDEVAESFGALHVLVNNAAVNYDPDRRASDVDLDVVRQTLETNLFGALWVTKAALPATVVT